MNDNLHISCFLTTCILKLVACQYEMRPGLSFHKTRNPDTNHEKCCQVEKQLNGGPSSTVYYRSSYF